MSEEIDYDTKLPTPGQDFIPATASRMQEVARAAVRTLDALEKAGARFPPPTGADRDAARAVFGKMTGAEVSEVPEAPAISRNETMTSGVAAHLRDLLSTYDKAVIDSAMQIRTYIVNKLLEETAHPDARIRLRALELLGKAADVNLFTEPSAGADPTKTSAEDLERRIRDKLRGIQSAADISFKDIDVVKELGL